MGQSGYSSCFSGVKASDTRILKSINLLAVLKVLRENSSVSRADIARITELTPATVSSIVSLLITAGIAKETGYGESTGGRPPVMVEFNPKAFYLAGVDLGVSKIISVVTDLEGNIVSKTRLELDAHQGVDSIMASLFEATHETLEQVRDVRDRIAGLGLSVPGLIDAERGISVFAPNIPGWSDIPIVKVFEDEFAIPCWVENDARAMAIGEAMFGAGRGHDNILCINVGRGIGAGIIMNGEIHRGKQGGAGELGHMTIDPNGPVCPCGNHGCLEAMAAGPAIAAAAIRAVSTGSSTLIRDIVDGKIEAITAEVVSQAAAQGDLLATRLIQEAGRYLGIGIANAVNLLSPDIVIIGGGVARAGDILFDEVRATVQKRAFTAMVNLPPILPSAQGEEASSVGAAALVFEEMLAVGSVANLMGESS
ncbi:MAG TPA: ROK family transcriptional regulator [Bacillota bacterium]|nr:ROK family transcriptional regulator [Bacillota bacterium]